MLKDYEETRLKKTKPCKLYSDRTKCKNYRDDKKECLRCKYNKKAKTTI